MEYRTTYGVYRNPLSPFTYDNGPPLSRLPSPTADLQQDMLVEQSRRPFHPMAINSLLLINNAENNTGSIADMENATDAEVPEASGRMAKNAGDSERQQTGITRAVSSDQVNLSGSLTPPSRVASSLPSPNEAREEEPLLPAAVTGEPSLNTRPPLIASPIPMRDFYQENFSPDTPGRIVRNICNPAVFATVWAEARERRNPFSPSYIEDRALFASSYVQCDCKRISPSMPGFSLTNKSSGHGLFDGAAESTPHSTSTTSGPHTPPCHRYYRDREDENRRLERQREAEREWEAENRAEAVEGPAQVVESQAQIVDSRIHVVDSRAYVVEARAERTNSDPGPRFVHPLLHSSNMMQRL